LYQKYSIKKNICAAKSIKQPQYRKMKIIFMGTPEFAVASLDILVKNNYNIVAVITAPDKPAGRGNELHQSGVKKYALANNLHILQPTNLKAADFLEELKNLNADLQIVVAFRMLPEIVWSMPPKGTFNLHASLLPKFRGAAPINWAIINGETETGVTTFFLQQEIDTGNIILQQKEPISPTDNVGDLYARLMKIGAELTLKTVQKIGRNDIQPRIQAGTPTHAPKIFRETCQINWDKTSKEIYDFIRGLSPYPAAWTTIKGKNCKIYATEIVNNLEEKSEDILGNSTNDNKNIAIGEFFIAENNKNIYFKTQNGTLKIKELQLEGKKRLLAEEFLRGFKAPNPKGE
jgi:methionyl-tRNA formyltransferase